MIFRSCAVHGDTGQSFNNAVPGNEPVDLKYVRQWRDGDVVGLGIIWETNEVFFTLNGEWMGVVWTALPPKVNKLYPSIGMRSRGACAKINFGAQPFQYDFKTST
jgi:hypothetical protein